MWYVFVLADKYYHHVMGGMLELIFIFDLLGKIDVRVSANLFLRGEVIHLPL